MIFGRLSSNRGTTLVRALLVTLILIGAAALGAFVGYFASSTFSKSGFGQNLSPPFGGKTLVHILVLGEDNTGIRKNGRGLSDTIMLVSVNFASKRVAAVSIPRDTRVDLDGYGNFQKINAAHVVGGPELVKCVVQQLVGILPDYYVKVNVEGFKQLVDVLGGVTIDVEKNMRYRDRKQNLYINLKKGVQLLDGEKAMQYVRFRHDALGDIARIQRQQKFVKALAKKALSPANYPKLPRVITTILRNMETDMTVRDVLYLAKIAKSIDIDSVETATLPGVPQNIGGVSYWIVDTAKASEVVNKLFFPELSVQLPRVEVLNGSGKTGAAQRVAEILRQQGYEITNVGNADSYNYDTSQIICNNDSVKDVTRIANIVNSTVVKRENNPSATADVTVIVGRNCTL
jgi:LCP family protein required for cell wall assembly